MPPRLSQPTLETVQDRILAYLAGAKYPNRRKLKVVASSLGISIRRIRPALDALERAGRLKIDRRKGSLVLNISDGTKGGPRKHL
jgi:DNA-binding GntR family transcriptional regulator